MCVKALSASLTIVCVKAPSASLTAVCIKAPSPLSTIIYVEAPSELLTVVCIVDRRLRQGTIYVAGAVGGGGKVCFILCICDGAE
jgi:hypothetical protein